MTEFIIALAIGIAAGAIDVLPMLNKQIPRISILFIFSQWTVIGLLIPFVNWDLALWLKGLIIGTLGMVPVAIITFPRNRKALPGIILYGAILGAAIGLANHWLN